MSDQPVKTRGRALSAPSAFLLVCFTLSPLLAFSPLFAFQQEPYFPDRHDWETRTPAEAGMDAGALSEAIEFARAHESSGPRDLALYHETMGFAREPYGSLVGPTTVRASLNGLVVRHGYIVAEWGDSAKVDMAFSVTKSFLSTIIGLAWDAGLIADLDDRVADHMPDRSLFEGDANSRITWDHLLRQTSDWKGELWGKPDWADRPEGDSPEDYPNPPRPGPGVRYEYNDVRVNLLALAALEVWRQPLPRILGERIMDPIGASNTWRWHGYENSWVLVDGLRVQSVSGGGHWGGGMFINARDLARFGLLFLRNGKWKDRQLISTDWIEMARQPGEMNPTYGFMNWFLNHDPGEEGASRLVGAAPDSAVLFLGAGRNAVYIDRDNDLVVVVRWIDDSMGEFLSRVIQAIRD
jgi:CubicO group peptidase (beta-lactamase class C family)